MKAEASISDITTPSLPTSLIAFLPLRASVVASP